MKNETLCKKNRLCVKKILLLLERFHPLFNSHFETKGNKLLTLPIINSL